MTLKKLCATGLLSVYILMNPYVHATAFSNANSTLDNMEENIKEIKAFTTDVVYRANTNKKVVALTFDDGPDPRYTPKILKILKQNKINATFFVVGESAKKYPNIINQAIKDGNEIENHTYTHPHSEDLEDSIMLKEVDKNNKLLSNSFKTTPIFFRPPRGLCRGSIIETLLKDNKMKTILWTICFEHKAQPDPYKRANEIAKVAKPGYIILAHDGRLNRTKTVKGVEYLIKDLKKKGFIFVTLKQVIK